MISRQEAKNRIRNKRGSWLRSMKKLLKWYQTGRGDEHSCPLCVSATGYCPECVWMYFMGRDCLTYHCAYEGSKSLVVSRTRRCCVDYPEWSEMRVKQLKSWIKNVKRWV